jgi:flagellar biosynthesis/type III secretory pathway protein FliH
MFFKSLRAHRSSKDAASISDTRPSTAFTSQCASSPNAPTEPPRAKRPDEEPHDYEMFLEQSRRKEEEREKAQQREIKEAARLREEFTMDPWTKRI